jgi:nitrogen fixation NifU-like protein
MAVKYSTKVMEHFANPHNVGEIADADGVGYVGNPVCGDIMELYIKVKDDIITDAKFKTFGCGAAIATSSMVTDMVKGKSIPEALEISNKAVAEALGGLPPIKMHCSVLAEQALHSAVDDYYKRRGLPSPVKLKPDAHLHIDEDDSGDACEEDVGEEGAAEEGAGGEDVNER